MSIQLPRLVLFSPLSSFYQSYLNLYIKMAATMPPTLPLGSSVPFMTAHAISVSLPTWDDNIGYEEADPRIIDKMETGYPRFFIHRSIQKVSP